MAEDMLHLISLSCNIRTVKSVKQLKAEKLKTDKILSPLCRHCYRQNTWQEHMQFTIEYLLLYIQLCLRSFSCFLVFFQEKLSSQYSW